MTTCVLQQHICRLHGIPHDDLEISFGCLAGTRSDTWKRCVRRRSRATLMMETIPGMIGSPPSCTTVTAYCRARVSHWIGSYVLLIITLCLFIDTYLGYGLELAVRGVNQHRDRVTPVREPLSFELYRQQHRKAKGDRCSSNVSNFKTKLEHVVSRTCSPSSAVVAGTRTNFRSACHQLRQTASACERSKCRRERPAELTTPVTATSTSNRTKRPISWC
jgi:hypothetical protein